MRALGFAAWVAALALAYGVPARGEDMDPFAYAGSDRCAECHQEMYEGWEKTFHATVVQNAKENPEAVLGDFSVPGIGFGLDEVEYTIGGHWDQRYMKKIGDDYYVLPKLWSVQSQSWRPYNVWSWRKKPYSKYCKGCHVTAYDPSGNVQAAEDRVGCEACHGPGWAHAESGGKQPVVNPKKLADDRREMICAGCHVRGQDTSGEYYFPVGFIPGEDLGKYYVPLDKAEGENNSEAILRNFKKWKEDRENQAKVRCEVCGIYGASSEKKEKKEEKVDGALDFCFGCHDFKNKYAEHTRHKDSENLVCFDCHVQQTKEIMNPQNLDIHSYGYFLVHADNCYDRRIENTCVACHEDRGLDWARQTVERWRLPVEVDH